ncbi:MAG: hybrid sensor histidine kinase/response regulator, partial [Bacteroidota bacterium]
MVLKGWKRNQTLYQLNQNLAAANTQLKTQQEEILKQKEAVHQAKLNFFTNISHEFRTPLTLIKGPVDRLIKGYSPSLIDSYLPILKRNTDALLKLVDEIMVFRKLESGHLPLSVQATEMVAFCQEVLASFQEQASQKHIDLRFIPAMPSLEAEIDREKLEKVCSNLVSNALKFTPQGGKISFFLTQAPLDSTVTLSKEVSIGESPTDLGRGFEIVVEDNGYGISEEALPRIFERFFQAKNQRGWLGTGVGLALTRELVLLYGGNIRVASQEGIGTRFTVRLPLTSPSQLRVQPSDPEPISPAVTAPASVDPAIISQVGKASKANPEGPGLEKTLLIVEDQADMQQFLAQELAATYRILTAQDGKAGIEMALAELPDMVVSDVMMPIMNGIEL